MFTGIVTAIGTVLSATLDRDVRRLLVRSPYAADSIALGASINCSGICLTVTSVLAAVDGADFGVDLGPETLALTTAGGWMAGARINLERSLRVGDELGGHIVSGHVDGVALVLAREAQGETVRFDFQAPAPHHRFIARKGSVALDGVSLTVNAVEGNRFSVHLIPHSLAVTTLGAWQIGSRVNLEADLMARYAARLAETAAPPR